MHSTNVIRIFVSEGAISLPFVVEQETTPQNQKTKETKRKTHQNHTLNEGAIPNLTQHLFKGLVEICSPEVGKRTTNIITSSRT